MYNDLTQYSRCHTSGILAESSGDCTRCGMVMWNRKDTLPLCKRTSCQEAVPKGRAPMAESSNSHSATPYCGDVTEAEAGSIVFL